MMKIFSRLKIGILCICMIVLNLSSMTIVEVPRVSATTFPSSEDFESSDGVGTNPRIIGDWEFALLKIDGTLDDSNNSNNDIDDFYPTDKSLGMSGYPGIVTTASIKSIKGNFKLNSLRLESAVNEIVELKIEGYRDNTFVTGAVVINQYMPFEKIDVPLTGEPWQNIDEIRISRTDGVADIFVRIYHLDVSASVTSTEDLIPPEISNPSINVMNISNNSVTLNWLKATDNITSTEDLEYQIYQSTSNNIDTVSHIETNGIALGNYSKDIATFDIPDLLQNTTYYFNIIVKDAAGNKTAYTMVNVTTLKAYSVSFSVDGGSTVPAQTIAHGEKATEPPPPTKAGYTFVGWYTSSSGNTPFNFDTTITGDITIYAKWSPVTHTVSFDVDGGSTISAQTIAHGEKATEPPPPTKAGHTFVGWYTSSTGNTPFNFDTAITGATTIYAKWNPVTHTVSFDVDGGSTIPAQTIAHGEKATEPPSPTKVGHTFVGWYTSSTGNTPFNFDTAITGATIVYAKWNPLTYTVSFDVDGGNTIPAQTIAHGEKATEPPSPTKAGHTFVGWYTSSSGNTAFNFDTAITGDTMIYAKWNPVTVTHTVSFDVAGGSAVSNQMVVHEGKASQPTKAPTKAGYTFGGWYTNNAYTTPYNFNTVITANTVIYAKWISNNTGGDNTDPSPNPDSGSSTPSTNVEEIVVDVESGNGDVVSKTTIKRAKNVDNTMNDDVTLTAASATETIRKLKEQGNDKARIIIPDEKDQVNQVQVSIPKNVLSLLQNGAVHLEIVTDNVRIEVPKTSLEMFNENLYFRLVPIKEYDKQLEIEEQAKRETVVQQLVEGRVVKLLGRPMTIETNMQSRPVKLTLPLPTDLTDEQLANLAIFIEHSDGTKEVVRGKVVEYQKGIGLQFEVNKFSTFSILYLPEKEEVKEPITEGVTHLPYIQGYPDDTFRPNAPVTRAQMASMFARQLTGNAIPQAKATYTDTFQHDAKDAIEFAKEKGLFKGVTATNFNPNGFITRAQMATVAARWIEQQCVERPDADFCSPTSQSAVFKDVSVHHWARQAIDTVNAAEIMTGITADTFNPDGLLTRAQAVKVLNRLFERQVLIGDQTPLFKDVPKHHWAFYEIQEAAKK